MMSRADWLTKINTPRKIVMETGAGIRVAAHPSRACTTGGTCTTAMKRNILSIAIALVLLVCSSMAVDQGEITSEEQSLAGHLNTDSYFPSDDRISRVVNEYAEERIQLFQVKIVRFSEVYT